MKSSKRVLWAVCAACAATGCVDRTMRFRRFRLVRAVAVCVVTAGVPLLGASAVFAQSTWNVAGDGNWNVAGNWTPSGVPNSTTVGVLIDGNPENDVTVTLNMNASVRDLTLDAGDALHISSGQTLTMHGDVTNDGEIYLNPTAASSSARFAADTDLELTGTGRLVLGRDGFASYILPSPGKTLTQRADHTIEGIGRIDVHLVNQGTVRADASLGSGSTLDLLNIVKTNHGQFSAVNGGTLHVHSGVLTNYDAGTATLSGGTYEVVGDSTMRLVGLNVQTLDAAVSLSGARAGLYNVATGTTSALAGLTTITAAGSLSVSDSASVSFSAVDNAGLLGGTGTFVGTINNAGPLSPGDSTGTLSITGDVFNTAEGLLLIEVAGSGAGEFDTLNVTGTYEVDGTLLVRFLPGSEDLLSSDLLTIVDTSSLVQSGETLAFSRTLVELSGDYDVLYDQSAGLMQLTGFQNIVPIPEPSAGLMLLAACLVLAISRRRAKVRENAY